MQGRLVKNEPIEKVMKGRKGTFLLLGAAVLLLAGSAVGSARAALTYYSENYTAQMEMYDIGVTLVEESAKGSKDISSRDYAGSDDAWKQNQGALLTDMLDETDGKLVAGRNYKEALSVKNSGNIDEYVRVRIYKSWKNEDGSKETTLAPSLIELNLTQNGWIVDENASTEERTVLYWPSVLKVGESTPAFSDTLKIDNSIMSKVTEHTTEENGLKTTTTTFNYNGVSFHVEAEVDAVQTHNAQDAIKSAWGVDVSVDSNGNLTLLQ